MYLLGAYLYDISSLNMIKVMDMIGSNQPYVNVDVSQSICYLVNLSFFNWSYIILSIVFSCSCVFFGVKICKKEYVKLKIQKQIIAEYQKQQQLGRNREDFDSTVKTIV